MCARGQRNLLLRVRLMQVLSRLRRRLVRLRRVIVRSSIAPIMASLRRRLLLGLLERLGLLVLLRRLLLFGRSSNAAFRFSSVIRRCNSILLLLRSVALSKDL